ncbi:dihydrolipoamide acetyltransferase family protein [Agitococcus lubricus]|uniref:Dihydrolipoamide acetyltransferase component of pyruvate dehydrogenase complex n=1 Tax=Agitococcus lubricus TaxID=1077255 RepID=A0A2T5IUZ4_9GAMM|nr:dihydrolipoamide acetyltransferase family protein [Agitococcus lubricus]PTQ87710.1 pyruvate dehydrogenase E2 component (dihydrolipoamide acetyltransferase) [Agitococcus lubricus]
MKTFSLPDLGEGLHEATVVEWYITNAQAVSQGTVIMAVETAKAIVDIPAPEDLFFIEALCPTNALVKVGAALFTYRTTEDKIERHPPSATTSVSVVGSLVEANTTASTQHFILGKDRFNTDEQRQAQQNLSASTRLLSISSDRQPQQLTGARLSMSQHMTHAQQTVALVTIFDEVYVKQSSPQGILTQVINGLIASCRQSPLTNAWLIDNSLIVHEHIHLGIAIDSPHGLFVPVIPKVDTLSERQISEKIKELKQQTQAHQLRAEQLQGATITVSNFGVFAGRFATPMVMPPQVAILGIGRLYRHNTLTNKGDIKTRLVIPLSFSFDHRALTGGEAAKFLATLIEKLQTPLSRRSNKKPQV